MKERIENIPGRCKACHRCEAACIAAHHNLTTKEAILKRPILTPCVHVIKEQDFKTTIRCQQCNPAPCCQICPKNALVQDESGEITMIEELCVACGMCVKACPYGAIAIDTPPLENGESALPACRQYRKHAARCDLCKSWRKETGKQHTACMEACHFQALALRLEDGTLIEMPKPEKKKVAASS